MSILDVVNIGGQAKSQAEMMAVTQNRISDKQLADIIDESTSNFFAQFDKVPESGIKVELTNDEGLGYVGSILVGGQPAKVLFDTGSDYLVVTSSLCNDKTLGLT